MILFQKKNSLDLKSVSLIYVVTLFFILIFQDVLVRNFTLPYLKVADEFLILSALGLILLVVCCTGKISIERHFKYFFLFSLSAAVALFINSNIIHYGLMGLLEVGKGYLAYLIGRCLFVGHHQVRFIMKVAMGIVIANILVAIAQELVGSSLINVFMDRIDIRYGIVRVSGLFTAINVYADYVVFFLAVLIGYQVTRVNISRRKFFFYAILGFVGIILTVSRQAVFGLFLATILSALHLYGLSFLRKVKSMAPFLGVISMVMLLGIISNADNKNYKVVPEGEYLRYYATFKSVEILMDHPLFGVGGGYFGGSTASRLNNYKVYDEYNFVFGGFSFEKMATIDTLWPQIWAEYGLIGFFLYLLIFISILDKNRGVFRELPSEIKVYCWSLHVCLIYMLITSFSGPKLTNPVTACFFLLQLGVIHSYAKANFIRYKHGSRRSESVG